MERYFEDEHRIEFRDRARLRYEESLNLHDTIRRSIKALDRFEYDLPASNKEFSVLAHSLRLMLVAMESGLGECRLSTPYSSLRPVIDQNGLRWCCNHNPEHCS